MDANGYPEFFSKIKEIKFIGKIVFYTITID